MADEEPTLDVKEARSPESDSSEVDRLFVVGIGASAGGLEALGELVRHVPSDSMAFVVIQHLAPDHESILTQLLARTARLQVLTATDGAVLEPNHVYVIPPNADLAVSHGVIRLTPPSTGCGLRLPIDYTFRSLAEDRGDAAIGIVLSGTGTDGTLGLEAIKAAGGFTFVQEPSTAKYDGMPRSALASGAADYSLSPEKIGEELARIAKQHRGRQRARPAKPAPVDEDQLARLFVLIRSELGNDLADYKTSTIHRRVERRMMLNRIGRLEDYVKYAQQHREELRVLYKDMLITVTSFFRDPEAFDALKAKVFPRLIEGRDPSQPIRIWVPACATGEEAYSLAMSLIEFCDEESRDQRFQVFGTDIDEDSVQHARRGVYPANIALDVSAERLNRFFVKRNDELLISRQVRNMLVFSRQNVLKDAPFSRLDLVSCRNLLIYLKPSAQKKVLRVLHYSLNPRGYLLLGSSETVADAPELFGPIDRKNKIYVKRPLARQALEVDFGRRAALEPPREPGASTPSPSLQGLADRKVLELYGPPGVVVNERLDILQFRGRTGPYLDPVPGTASLNILKVARFELHIELKSALEQALSRRERVTTEVAYREEGKQARLRLDVIPLQDREREEQCLLVLFHRLPAPAEVPVVATGEAAQDTGPLVRQLQELERELAVTKEYLHSSIEEKESTLEELKSTNEELETSKEEMQSTNEELTTVNDELHDRMTELSLINDDLHNILTGVDNAVVIVGMDFRIRRYTQAAERLFNLVPGDIGRSIGFLDGFLGTGPLEPKVSDVIQSLSALEEEVLASNQRWYSLRISPYKTLDHAIRGALVTLIDIDVRRRAEEMTRDVAQYAEKVLGAIAHPLIIVDQRLRIVWASDAFLSGFQLSSGETLGSTLATLGERQFSDPILLERIRDVFASSAIIRDHQARFRLPDGSEHTARIGASQIPVSAEQPLVLLSIELDGRLPPRRTP